MNKLKGPADYTAYIRKSNILKGTIILTLAGLFTRVLGFFYKIFLSKTMGPELLGIYQLVFPIYGICFTIYATGIQTAISSLVSAEMAKKNHKNARRILKIGLLLSVGLASILAALVYFNAEFLASRFIMEVRSTSSIRILAIVFPFCGVTSCINGYYYGLKKTGIPASTQLLEQIIRVAAVYVFALYFGKGDLKVTCELAVLGLVIGEIFSSLYNVFSIFLTKTPAQLMEDQLDPTSISYSNRKITRQILGLSIPLSANRLFINILHSLEAILIPTMLRRFGLSQPEALSAFGILNGMSIPFILFPTAVINALAVLILPTISEAQAVKNTFLIGKTTAVSIKYSLIIGIMSTGIFLVFGQDLGLAVFNNQEAGQYLITLAWLCPFIYLATILSSIINGLGKAHITFINSVIGSVCKIILLVILIPRLGIQGYLISLLICQLIITALDSIQIAKNIPFGFHAMDSLVKPGLITALLGFLIKAIYNYSQSIVKGHDLILILGFCMIYGIFSLGFMLITKTISKHELK